MDIRINKASEVPVRQQLAHQIVYLIATEKLKPGVALPSVRELARRLKIHHNTVSEAYQALVRRTWLVRRRGTRLVVRGFSGGAAKTRLDLDDVINDGIRISREQGYTLQELRRRVRERLMAEPPDHILVVEEEAGLQRVLKAEIRAAGRWPVQSCSRQELAADPARAIGALVTTPQYLFGDVGGLALKKLPPVPLAFSDAEEQLGRIRRLREASVVAVVSVSAAFLATARSVLAPALGARHSLVEFLAPLEDAAALRAADLVFCDSVARKLAKSPNCALYRLVDEASMAYLMSAMESYQTS
jgi:DNA-binding transcriptional regulator YhcF (GntR family)